MAQFREIPLNKLKLSPRNMRQGEVDFSDLEANFRQTKEILQNLRVTAEVDEATGKATGMFEVHVGGRRLRMLQKLAGEKFIGKTFTVPCQVLDDASKAHEESVAENYQRLPPTDAERFRAFHQLATDGMSEERIAETYGIPVLIVKRRLAYANVSPRIFELFERNEIGLDQMTALCLADNHEQQEAAFFGVPEHMRQAWQIKRRLTEDKHGTDHWMLRFVGVEAFQNAGGVIITDLFSEKDEGHFTDMALVERLALAKLEAEAETVKGEGWAWVEAVTTYNHGAYEKFGRVYPAPLGLSAEDQAKVDDLEAKLEPLQVEAQGSEDDGLWDEVDALENQIEELKRSAGEAYADEDKLIAGAVVKISGDSIKVERGLVKPGPDLKALKARKASAEAKGEGASVAASVPASSKREDGLSQSMVARLTAHRTMALRAELVKRPDVALVAVTHRLLSLAFYRDGNSYGGGWTPDSALVLTGVNYQTDVKQHADDLASSPAAVAINAAREAIRAELPGDTLALWDYLMGLDATKLSQLMAFAVSLNVYAVEPAGQSTQQARKEGANQLARALDLDMADYWTADAGFFHTLGKPDLTKALQEGAAVDPATVASLKKGELAEKATVELEGKRWLPAILRTSPAPSIAEVPKETLIRASVTSYHDEEDDAALDAA